MAEWYEEEAAFEPTPDRGPGSVTDWFNQPEATGKRFPIDPEITPEQLDVLPEMTDTAKMIEGFSDTGTGPISGTLKRMGTELSQGWLQMTTTDPMELGAQLQNRFPDVVEVRLAPHPDPEEAGSFIPVARNKLTGYEAVINKPGMTGQDVLQTIGLVGQFLPSTKATMAVKSLAPRAATAAITAGGTEALAQTGQAMAGGEFDPEDIALATVFGTLPEFLAKPAVGLAMKGKELVGKVADIVPNTIGQALDFAKARGLTITTADALAERLTPPQQIFLKITERIPVFGTQAIKNRQKAQRADVLKQVSDEFGIDIETDLGQEIAKNWVDRMKSWRFFGRNQNPTDEMVNRAFKREANDVIDATLKKKIAGATVENGNVNDVLVDQIFKSDNPIRVKDLFNKLTPEGQQAARQRFLTEGLSRAGWKPGQQVGIASPGTFVKYLDDHAKSMKAMFPDPDQRATLEGAREFLRITDTAEKASQGAGMTAALAAGGGFYLFDIMGGAIAGMGTGLLGRGVQSAPVRNLMLRLAHAKGNPELTNSIMRELRPLILATGTQVLQGEVDMPALNMAISPDMVQEGAASGMEATMKILRGVTQTMNPYQFLGGAESPLTGPGLEGLEQFGQPGVEPEE